MSNRLRERRLLAALFAGGLALMAATQLPYLYGRAIAPPDRAFLWTHSLNSGDLYAYLGQIERVRDGELLARNNFTIDGPNDGMLRPTYLLLGLAARASGLPAIAVFHGGRIVLGALFLTAFYLLAGCALEARRTRILAVVLAATSSGLGWLLRGVLGRRSSPDTWQPEANVFMALYESPHFTAALLGIAVAVLLLIRAVTRCTAPTAGPLEYLLPAAGAGLAALLVLLDHPFDTITLTVVAALVIGWGRLSLKAPAARLAAIALAAGALAAPGPLLTLLQVRDDAVLQAWARQNVLPSPPPHGYLIAYGLLWPLALLGWRAIHASRAASSPSPSRELPAGAATVFALWALAGFVLVYLPVAYQRRLAEGWHLPLAILAAAGAERVLSRLGRRPIATVLLVMLLSAGTVSLLRDEVRFYRSLDPDAYVPRELYAAAEALGDRVDHRDALLANPRLSYLASGLAGCHVLAGQRIQTVVLPETARTIEEGLAALSDPSRMDRVQALLQLAAERRLKYVAFDAACPAPPCAVAPKSLAFGRVRLALANDPGWKRLFENSLVTVYELPRPD